MSILVYTELYACTLGTTSSAAYSSTVFAVHGVSEFTKAEPSMIMTLASDFASDVI